MFNRSNDVMHAGAISGTGTLTKQNSNTLTLTANNSYSGMTTVAAGTLLVNGNQTGTGSVVVNSGATLGGSGLVAGAVTVQSGGTLSPGASVESLGAGGVTFDSGSTFKYEINTTANTADLVNAMTGALSIASNVSLVGIDLNPIPTAITGTTHKYTMIAYDSALSPNVGTFDGLPELGIYTFTPGGKRFKIRYADTSPGINFAGDLAGAPSSTRYVTLTAVPELGSFITMTLTGCFAILAIRMSKRYGVALFGPRGRVSPRRE